MKDTAHISGFVWRGHTSLKCFSYPMVSYTVLVLFSLLKNLLFSHISQQCQISCGGKRFLWECQMQLWNT